MGHLKRIGRKECCDHCTPGKCDDCGPSCTIFDIRSICTVIPFRLHKHGWTPYQYLDCAATPTPRPAGECDMCARYLSKAVENIPGEDSDGAQYCIDSESGGTYSRNTGFRYWEGEDIHYDLNAPNAGSTEPDFGTACLGIHIGTWQDYRLSGFSSGGNDPSDLDACYTGLIPDPPSPISDFCGIGCRRSFGYWPRTSTCTTSTITSEPPSTIPSNWTAWEFSGGYRETLYNENHWGEVIERELTECERTDCIAGTVQFFSELEEMAEDSETEPDVDTVWRVTHIDEETEHCGDGMHYLYMGGEQWLALGLLYRCPYESPNTPANCYQVSHGGPLLAYIYAGNALVCTGSSAYIDTNSTVRSTAFSIALSNLEIGKEYEFKLIFRRCEYTYNPAAHPNCDAADPWAGGAECGEDPENWEEFEQSIIFEATHWAEILTSDCTRLAVRVRECQLENTAADLNANDGGSREVNCSTDIEGELLRIPMERNMVTQLLRCELTEIEPNED